MEALRFSAGEPVRFADTTLYTTEEYKALIPKFIHFHRIRHIVESDLGNLEKIFGK